MSMETLLWKKVNDPAEIDGSIKEAAALLQEKQVVAFPTETVYGLGADATEEEAVQRIFEAKGRPSDNPLIVHVADRRQVEELVSEIPPMARQLMDQFWPGPLTLVLNSNGTAAENVTAGLSTIGVRMPDHPLALTLLRVAGKPLAAPSANRSGRPSPTTADHVYQDLDGRIAGILDGGPTGVGLESTVIDCTTEVPIILRPGGITKEDLEEVLPQVMIDPALANEKEKPKSPGMKYTHYAPESPLWLIDGKDEFFMRQLDQLKVDGKRVGVIASDELADQMDHQPLIRCGSRTQLRQVAERLYGALREFKKSDVDVILCESFPEKGVGAAIMNRLNKAAVKKIQTC
ncbi:t(6)A37 threonylcarbamoyladenosine biosynthesis protein RimN [Halobacillus karajensis]|uniref:Threonylcarbamoyl-AMP synthase n=2 Tax=Halobacillus karajensis TaxID=195088 RepID=A0A024P492_9BACI|nr:L-threonylcarbamoyladenylate synthase [Halobacillus karajensis]CDQ18821.1 t(6)A37 threonylcarbamoyladenosine biosynthesis protein RimN [Halobacillus karajensis]CDQ23106.1 t(6)A37 threonylcarbamoyladenosine biosynthesis protein RimN [Halobacillus karajensis]CDQ26588.1 t(6)A37 threonylcarbamoyladenosine biosynthesis protein RimN [Halobacillus karajensis]